MAEAIKSVDFDHKFEIWSNIAICHMKLLSLCGIRNVRHAKKSREIRTSGIKGEKNNTIALTRL